MKKIILSLLVTTAIMGLSSCSEDKLDIEPTIIEIYTGDLKTEEEMLWATNNIYNSLASESLFGAGLLINADIISDNVFASNILESGYYQTQQSMGWSGDSGFGPFRSLYDVIQKANFVIYDENLPETAVVKSFKGEAKIARGLAYFYLVQLFSSNPTSGQYQEYGVPLMLEKYTTPNVNPARATVAQNYDQIIKDLTEGISEMNPGSRVSKTFLSPTAGRLILSKVYLTRGASGDYDKAIQYATEVLENSPSNFEVITNDKLYDYFTGTTEAKSEEQPETIYEIEQKSGFSLQINAHPATFYSNQGTHKGLLIREWVYELFDGVDTPNKDDDDSRVALINTSGPDQDTPKGVWTRKYPRSVGGNWFGNIKVFRMTEAKYVIMEAMAKKGDNAGALAMLNEHAAERKAQPYSGDALTAILLDAQKEFVAEGHRFFDLKRNNLGFDKKTNCLGDKCSIPADSRYFVYPISLSSRLLNTNMTQHPLWGN
ncbi:RagB/SusD family nutrient uptake outer membrane protein [Empedobacter falsenii]|uniref:RagB/SusD family nutrient uptake outer membrane protein n=1 Tax=Empedobacter stercoris TaxID=1628248 RepID=UPI001CE1C8F3|nr:RagB/SusD family nutrient uptake outer membrane protein [Empedobacter stercoris]MCA4776902.1 RagB/SusD family nutrient uptake outer membrane protein [Empedobacter stercoris]